MRIEATHSLRHDAINASREGMREIKRALDAQIPIVTPVAEDEPDAGHLLRSYSSDIDAETNTIHAGYEADYAEYVEMGHHTRNGKWVSGQYFLRQALRNIEGDYHE